ncbi:MAG: hydrogenase nickel incorporation protein HypB [Methylocystaceae bacterium]
MKQVKLNTSILNVNDMLAGKNRNQFAAYRMLVLNIMSSPGAGKTTILERTIEKLSHTLQIGVIEGDLYTDQDARRIEGQGIPVVQINTEGGCHLDASMVERASRELPLGKLELLIIENVGNLVCPAEFDLGEDGKVVVLSATEGNDKVTKYPLMFREARAILLNKIDLLPYIDFDLDSFKQDVAHINPEAKLFIISARTGEGIENWVNWLEEEVRLKTSRHL